MQQGDFFHGLYSYLTRPSSERGSCILSMLFPTEDAKDPALEIFDGDFEGDGDPSRSITAGATLEGDIILESFVDHPPSTDLRATCRNGP